MFTVCSVPQVYVQLAEDDKVRYKNEIKSWEEHMSEIGRQDLIREQTRSAKRKSVAKKKGAKAAKAKVVKKTAGTVVPWSTRKPTKSKTSKKT